MSGGSVVIKHSGNSQMVFAESLFESKVLIGTEYPELMTVMTKFCFASVLQTNPRLLHYIACRCGRSLHGVVVNKGQHLLFLKYLLLMEAY